MNDSAQVCDYCRQHRLDAEFYREHYENELPIDGCYCDDCMNERPEAEQTRTIRQLGAGGPTMEAVKDRTEPEDLGDNELVEMYARTRESNHPDTPYLSTELGQEIRDRLLHRREEIARLRLHDGIIWDYEKEDPDAIRNEQIELARRELDEAIEAEERQDDTDWFGMRSRLMRVRSRLFIAANPRAIMDNQEEDSP